MYHMSPPPRPTVPISIFNFFFKQCKNIFKSPTPWVAVYHYPQKKMGQFLQNFKILNQICGLQVFNGSFWSKPGENNHPIFSTLYTSLNPLFYEKIIIFDVNLIF